jgi:hypothetical protein
MPQAAADVVVLSRFNSIAKVLSQSFSFILSSYKMKRNGAEPPFPANYFAAYFFAFRGYAVDDNPGNLFDSFFESCEVIF